MTFTYSDDALINYEDIGVLEGSAGGTATSFRVSAPGSATRGVSFTFSVRALDTLGNSATSYTGTVHITSSDGAVTLPSDAALSSGFGTFTITLNTNGTQTVTATDTLDSSITGNDSVFVHDPPAPAPIPPAGKPILQEDATQLLMEGSA